MAKMRPQSHSGVSHPCAPTTQSAQARHFWGLWEGPPVAAPHLEQAPSHQDQLVHHCQQGDAPHGHIHHLDGLELQELAVALRSQTAVSAPRAAWPRGSCAWALAGVSQLQSLVCPRLVPSHCTSVAMKPWGRGA